MRKVELSQEARESHALRLRLLISGAVQGVGFRPFVYRLANSLALSGWVENNPQGVTIEVEGAHPAVAEFHRRLKADKPQLASILSCESHEIDPCSDGAFVIRRSSHGGLRTALVLPDVATCPACLADIADATDRRFRYPFTNCTHCGPRFSIVEALPYDRVNTSMAGFVMCDACHREYDDPADRRFHAQPTACPKCGPQLRLLDQQGHELPGDPIKGAAAQLTAGNIVAIKGIGGYHLACAADIEAAVATLRNRKLRDGKPLAMMVRDVAEARRFCRLTEADEAALRSPAAPIVLARKCPDAALAANVASGCSDYGVMLAYSPVHHLLLAEVQRPLVMTSGNLAGQPLTYRDDEAFRDLGDVADVFLTHDRAIVRPIDDSVVFTFRQQVVPIRRARGYAPHPIVLNVRPEATNGTHKQGNPPLRVLAVGGELKNTFCMLSDSGAILSEHLGDLTQPDAYRHFVRAIERFQTLFEFKPDLVAHDLHPQYLSTQYARAMELPSIEVQHHHAHVASLMAEWNESGPIIGVVCDGTGYGTDGAIWGCEVLHCERDMYARIGHLDYFPLVGGDSAALETWRPAASLLRAALGESWREVVREAAPQVWEHLENGNGKALEIFDAQIRRRLNTVDTSSLGRVFDAVSFLLGLCKHNRHEAEAAMALEACAAEITGVVEPFPFVLLGPENRFTISLAPALQELLQELGNNEAIPLLAARFHETVARALSNAAVRAGHALDVSVVGLSGGCFLNRLLLARTVELLESHGLRVLVHQAVPPGDGGLALGQAYVAMWQSSRNK